MIERRSGRERARRLGLVLCRDWDREISLLYGMTVTRTLTLTLTLTLKPDHFIMYSLSGALMAAKKGFL
jgi:hypothetical protein